MVCIPCEVHEEAQPKCRAQRKFTTKLYTTCVYDKQEKRKKKKKNEQHLIEQKRKLREMEMI